MKIKNLLINIISKISEPIKDRLKKARRWYWDEVGLIHRDISANFDLFMEEFRDEIRRLSDVKNLKFMTICSFNAYITNFKQTITDKNYRIEALKQQWTDICESFSEIYEEVFSDFFCFWFYFRNFIVTEILAMDAQESIRWGRNFFYAPLPELKQNFRSVKQFILQLDIFILTLWHERPLNMKFFKRCAYEMISNFRLLVIDIIKSFFPEFIVEIFLKKSKKKIKIFKKLQKKLTNQELFELKSERMQRRYKSYIFKMPMEWVEYNLRRRQKHFFHIVSNSPWPICTSISVTFLIFGLLFILHDIPNGSLLFFTGLFLVIASMFFWFRDIIRESTYMGYHTLAVQKNLRTGFILFIISEVMFFFSFFWAYFHCALSPSIWSGCIWPPEGIVYFFVSENLSAIFSFHENIHTDNIYVNNFYWTKYLASNFLFDICEQNIIMNCKEWGLNFIYEDSYLYNKSMIEPHMDWFNEMCYSSEAFKLNKFLYINNTIKYDDGTFIFYLNLFNKGVLLNPYKYPLLNTAILLTSGCFLTLSHSLLRIERFLYSIITLAITIIFAVSFVCCQYYEYVHAAFSINDGIYGSLFYMLTGFHGFHVIVGTIFLTVCLLRFLNMHFTRTDHFGFEAAIWYWHFVDVVWIFLFFVVYLWPSIYFFEGFGGTFTTIDYMTVNLNTKFLKEIQVVNTIINLKNDFNILFIDDLNYSSEDDNEEFKKLLEKLKYYNFNKCRHFLEPFGYSVWNSNFFTTYTFEEYQNKHTFYQISYFKELLDLIPWNYVVNSWFMVNFIFFKIFWYASKVFLVIPCFIWFNYIPELHCLISLGWQIDIFDLSKNLFINFTNTPWFLPSDLQNAFWIFDKNYDLMYYYYKLTVDLFTFLQLLDISFFMIFVYNVYVDENIFLSLSEVFWSIALVEDDACKYIMTSAITALLNILYKPVLFLLLLIWPLNMLTPAFIIKFNLDAL